MRATDGLGNTTSKTLNIKVGDTTKPGLEVGGELAEAPEGWIEQAEGNYGLHATATDSGYGVTSLNFKVDGASVASKSQSCPAGRCELTLTASVDAQILSAGPHPAEVTATDAAGNTAVKNWTIEVDPEGEVSVAEAKRTIEGVEETSEIETPTGGTVLEPATSSQPTPGLMVTDDGLEGTNTEVPIRLGSTPAEGTEYEVADEVYLSRACFGESESTEDGSGEVAELELEHNGTSAEGSPQCTVAERDKLEAEARAEEEEVAMGLKTIGREPITIVPLATSTSGPMTPVQNSAALATDTHDEADTVFRPMSDGGYYFEDIRSAAAPERYSFEMLIGSEQELILVSSREAEVKYNEGGPVAVTITALEAHDAIGTSVPTHLSISASDVLTLTVEHRGVSPAGGGFVYPVVAGAGWEGGFRTFSAELSEPVPPQEEGGVITEEEGILHVHITIRGPMSKDENGDPEGFYAFHECVARSSYSKAMEEAEEIEIGGKAGAGGGVGGDEYSVQREIIAPCIELKEEGLLAAGMAVRGIVHVIPSQWVWVNEKQKECKKWGIDQPAMVHCYLQPEKSRVAMTAGGNFRMPADLEGFHESNCYTVYGHLSSEPPYIDQQERIISTAGADQYFEKCQWPAE